MVLMTAIVAVSIVIVGYFIASEIAYVGYQLEQLQEKFHVFSVELEQKEEGDENE